MAETLKEFAKRRLTELNRNPFEAARIAGAERTFVRDILIGRKLSIHGKNLAKLAAALDSTPEEVAAALAGTAAPRARGQSEVVPAAVPVPIADELLRDVPVYGSAGAAIVEVASRGRKVEGFILDRQKAVDRVARLPGIAGAPEAYAVYVAGESMAPKIEAGELRFVHPHRPVRPGDVVLILVRPGEGRPLQAFVKIFRGRTAKAVIAEQLNPKAVIEFRTETVEAVHKVLDYAELAGA